MNIEPPAPTVEHHCPHCGAELYALGARECWMCRGPLTPQEGLAEQVILPASTGDRLGLVLFCLLIALVFVGLAVAAPGLALLLGILAVPALLQMANIAARRRKEGWPLSGREKVGTFLATLGLIVAVILALVVAVFATCWAIFTGGGRGPDSLLLGVLCGGVVGALVIFGALHLIWGQRD
jgi:hypothetical protein